MSTINVDTVFEEATNSRKFSLMVVASCFLFMLLDGYEQGIISNAAPILMKDWHVSTAIFGSVFSAGNIGWAVGAATVGPIADRIGRKKMLLVGALLFSLGTLATVFVNNVSSLVAVRFFTGCGIGSAIPCALVLTSEFSKNKSKAKNISIMFSGFIFGIALGGILASKLISAFGWHSMFIVGFIIPLPIIIIMKYTLPESIKWLAIRGKTEQHRNMLISILKRIEPNLEIDANTQFIAIEKKREKYSFKQLFEGKWALVTPLLWFFYIISSLGIFFVQQWLPQLFVLQGYSAATASFWSGISMLFGIAGCIAIGCFLDIAGFKWAAIFPLLACITTAMTGHMTGGMFIMIVSVGNFFRNAEHNILTALSPLIYPVGIRTQGQSTAAAMARIGSISGPLVGGILMAMNMSITHLFYIIAASYIVCTIAAVILGYLYEEHIAPQLTGIPAKKSVSLNSITSS